MKNNPLKKSLSVFLAVLMLLTSWVWVPGEHNHASAADGTVAPSAWTAVYDGGSGDRGDSGKIVICSDGRSYNTTVGHVKFDISSFSKKVSNATLTVNAGKHSGDAIPSTVNIFMINPTKCVAVSGTYKMNGISTVYNSNYSSAANVYTHYGISSGEALGSITQSNTASHTFDVTNAVNTAKTNGWTEFCLIFMMPQKYSDNGSPGWSDVQIYPSGTSLSYIAAPDASDTGVPIVDINTDAANSVIGLDTSYNTVHGSFGSDDDRLTEADYNAVYHNVLYTNGTVTTSGSGSGNNRSGWAAQSGYVQYGSSGTGSNGIYVYWYHPVATLLYDGDHSQEVARGDESKLPRLGVAINTVMYQSNLWSRTTVNRLSFVESGGNGFNFTQNWHGSDTRLNFQYMWNSQSEMMGYTSTVQNEKMKQTLEGNNNDHFYANLLKFTGTMSDTEYYRSANPKFGFLGGNSDSQKMYIYATGGSNNTIYIINYVPLRTAIEDAMIKLQEIKDYPGKYTIDSVASFVSAAKALVAAKPNNYINSTLNNVTGWASAAQTAVNAYNKVNLELATYDVTYENLFSFSNWVNSNSGYVATSLKGTMTHDVTAGTIKFVNNAGNTQADPNDHYSSQGFGNRHYNVTLTPGETYTFEYTTSGGTGDQVHIFFYDDNGNEIANPANRGYPFANAYGSGNGKSTITFTAPQNATKASFRFGSTVLGETVTFSDIVLYTHTRGDLVDIANWTNRPVRKTFRYNNVLGTNLDVPARTGYTFNGWWVDTVYPNGTKEPEEQVTDGNGTVISELQDYGIVQHWNLYSEWTENTYNIKFNANGGSGTMSDISNVKYTESRALTSNAFSRTGYTFTGWNTKADGTGTSYADGVTVSKLTANNGENVTLYAQWTINRYTVTFNYYDGSSDTKTYDYGTIISVPSNTTKESDATYHYVYTWLPSVETTVTKDVTYTESFSEFAHNWGDWRTSVYATCTSEGKKIRVCNDCGYTETEIINKLAHTLVHMDAKPATCTANGSIEYWYCDECGKMFNDSNAANEITSVVDTAKGHTETDIPAVPATCSSTGLTAGKKCSVCDAITVAQEITPKIAHTEEVIPAVDATCTSTGLTAGKKCSVCDEILVAQTDTDMLPHSLGNWITDKEPTCITPGTKHRDCENCDYTENGTIEATGEHVYGKWTKNDAKTHMGQCEKDENCTQTITEAHIKSDTVKAYDSAYHYYKCEKCETYGDILNGAFTEHVKESCYGEGSTFEQIADNENQHKKICKCGNEKNDGHKWSGWVADPVNKDDNQGRMSNTCSECSYKKYTTCTYEATETVNASCTAAGHKTWKCTDCDNGYSEILPAINHENKVYHPKDPATCAAEGTVEYWSCPDCSKNFSDEACQTEVTVLAIPEDASNHVNTKEHSQTDATCLDKGYTAGIFCEDCDKWISGHEEIPATDHDYDTTKSESNLARPVLVDGVWTKGYYTYKCKNNPSHTTKEEVNRADYTEYETALKKLEELLKTDLTDEAREEINSAIEANNIDDDLISSEQNIVKVAVEALETVYEKNQGSFKSYTVKFVVDGVTVKTDVVVSGNSAVAPTDVTKASDENNHYTFDKWDIGFTGVTSDLTVTALFTSEAHNFTGHTDKDDSYHTDKCACGYKKDVEHSYNDGEITTEPTCTDKGEKTYTCSVCSGTKTEEVKENGHSYTFVVTPPTCTEQGYTTYTCSVCNTGYASDFVAPNDHTPGEAVQEDVKPATCYAEGSYNEVVYCSVAECHEKLSSTPKTIEKIAHTPAEAVIENEVLATCDAMGSYEEVVYCSVDDCNAVISRTKKYTDKVSHNWDVWVSIGDGQHERVCKSFASHTEIASCYDADNDKYCDACGAYTVNCKHEFTTGNSDEDFVVVIEPTCYSTGSKSRRCILCDGYNTEEYIDIPMKQHNYTSVTVSATCTENGSVTYTCANDGCTSAAQGHSYVVVITAKGHSAIGDWIVEREATCTQTGLKFKRCNNCKDHAEEQIIEKLSHSFGAWTVVSEPNCITDGSKVRSCACGETETAVIKATGVHNAVIIEGFEATCSKDGLTDGYYCSECDMTLEEQTVIPADESLHSDKNEDGECDECRTHIVVYDSCSCHSNNFISKIIRFFYTIISKIFGKRITCCPDMEFSF